MCAADGTRRSFAAVEQAAILAGSQVHLTLLAVTAEGGSGRLSIGRYQPFTSAAHPRARGRLAEHGEVACSTVLDPAGPPSQVILERAADHDLLALGGPWASSTAPMSSQRWPHSSHACGGRLTLVHVAGMESRARLHRIEAQGETLRTLGVSSEVRVEGGAADEAIMHVPSEAGCSLVLMSSRRLGGLGSLGRVSRRVVHKARCSVLLVPPLLKDG